MPALVTHFVLPMELQAPKGGTQQQLDNSGVVVVDCQVQRCLSPLQEGVLDVDGHHF